MAHEIKVRPERLDAARTQAGYQSDYSLAKAMDVNRSTVVRVLVGSMRPGAQFIAGALVAFPHNRFEDLFAIEPS